jgi:hypothetical protein
LSPATVPEARRRAALGIQAAAQAIGLASGPVLGGLLVSTAGWRWVFLLNVPVGLVAIAAGVYLLPRTRELASRGGTDLPGMTLLAATVTAGMLAISAVSGLRWPAGAVAGCAVATAMAGAALRRAERCSPVPLPDFPALAASGAARALGGALCSYLVLFGPLVLIPQVVAARGGTALDAGLLLTALPAGFGVTAAVADRLPGALATNRARCLAGGAVAAGCAAGLAVQQLAVRPPQAVTMILLGLLGAGLGLYTPANNAEVMTVLPARDAATAGGMVNMTRGIGTALGVAVVTLGLHIARDAGHPAAGAALSMGLLAVAGMAAAAAGAGAKAAGAEPTAADAGAARPAATCGRPRHARLPDGGQ